MAGNPFDYSVNFVQNYPTSNLGQPGLCQCQLDALKNKQDGTVEAKMMDHPSDVQLVVSNLDQSVDTGTPVSTLSPDFLYSSPTAMYAQQLADGRVIYPQQLADGTVIYPQQLADGTVIYSQQPPMSNVVSQPMSSVVSQPMSSVVVSKTVTKTAAPPAKCNAVTCGNKGWCLPFILYLVFSLIIVIGFIFSKQSMNTTVVFFILQLLWIILIAAIIFWLCKRGKVGWAWFVLLLPLIIQGIWVLGSWLWAPSTN